MERSCGRLPNGRFAPKSRPAGRKKGTPNRATRAIKEFLAQLVEDVGVQDAVRERILASEVGAFFRAIDHVIGKPRETIDATQAGNITISWKDSLMERLQEGSDESS